MYMKKIQVIYDDENSKREAESFAEMLSVGGWKYCVCKNTNIKKTDSTFIVYFCSPTDSAIAECKKIVQYLINNETYDKIYTVGIDLLRTPIKGTCMLGRGEGKQLFNLLCGVDISRGCNNFCTFCKLPYIEGQVINRDIDDILNEFRGRVAKNRVSQIVYINGTSVSNYKCPRTGVGYAGLLEKFCEIIIKEKAPHKICFGINPKDFTHELFDVISKYSNILCYIHLDLQSGSDRILKLMNRKYTIKQYLQIVDDLRAIVPNLHIGTHVICGFPTETEKDFQLTIDIVKRVQFETMTILPYLRRSGTVADKMDGHLDKAVILERVARLQKIYRELGGTGATHLF